MLKCTRYRYIYHVSFFPFFSCFFFSPQHPQCRRMPVFTGEYMLLAGYDLTIDCASFLSGSVT